MFFNVSSMAIRRRAIDSPKAIELLKSLKGGANDYAIVALVARARGYLYLTQEPLTYYRLWSGYRRIFLQLLNGDVRGFLESYIRSIASQKEDFKLLMEQVAGTPVEEAYISRYLFMTFTLCDLKEYGGSSATIEDLRLLLKYLLKWPTRAFNLRPEALEYNPLPRALACALPRFVRERLITVRLTQVANKFAPSRTAGLQAKP